ncbi:MAG: aminodeoxychorismate/anthranilate synthase component II [Bacteroidales bacterium]|nr:aminodeoxychorismate/anthranilate synthase component II [Bacteroidales bacterium]
MRILLIDNYDSFTFNVLHLIQKVCDASDTVEVVLNDKIDLSQTTTYDSIVISPGPGTPAEAGNIMDIIEKLYTRKPILGICLGHQAIAEALGAKIYCMNRPLHGIQSTLNVLDHSTIFKDTGTNFLVGHYHSWLVDKDSFPDSLKILATDNDGNIMALSHPLYKVYGVQFHPESFMTDYGSQIVNNFLKYR